MASLVTVSRYQLITGDTTSATATVEDALEDAQGLAEEFLRRELTSQERTESLQVYPGARVYPSVTPITAADGYDIDGYSLIGVAPDLSPFPFDPPSSRGVMGSVTYTGGYSAATLPKTIERVIARTAYQQLHPETLQPAGATSIRLGDAAITYAEPIKLIELSQGAQAQLRPYRRQRV